jgi:hypothetical protein
MSDRNSKVPGFEFRKGVNSFPNFRGINRQDDPGAIPPNQFYLLQNVRVEGSEIISRPGLFDGLNVGELTGMIDNLEEPFGLNGVILNNAVGFDNPNFILNLTNNNTIRTYQINSIEDIEGPYCLTEDGDLTLYLAGQLPSSAETSGFYLLTIDLFDFDGTSLTVTNLGLESVGSDAFPTSVKAFDGNIYIGIADDGGEPSRIYFWDGAVYTQETTGPAHAPILIEDHLGELLAGYSTVDGVLPTVLTRRNSGVWSNITLPVGVTNFNAHAAATFDGATYFAGYSTSNKNGYILKWNGSALSVVVGPLANNTPIIGLAEFGNYLYYLWGTSSTLKLGRFDGDVTWTDSYFDLGSQFSDTAAITSLSFPSTAATILVNGYTGGNRSLIVLANSINSNEDTPKTYILASTATDTSTWTEITNYPYRLTTGYGDVGYAYPTV